MFANAPAHSLGVLDVHREELLVSEASPAREYS